MSGTMVVLLRAFDVRYLEDDAMTCWHARVRVRVRRFGTCPDMSLALPKCSEYDEKKYIGYQDAFALLVPKLIKIWNKVVIASCNKGWQLHRTCYKLSQQDLVLPARNNLLPGWRQQTLWQLDEITAMLQVLHRLATTRLRTHLIGKLRTFAAESIWNVTKNVIPSLPKFND